MPGIIEQLAEKAKEFERKTGAPPLSKFLETIDKLPDERRLKLIKELLVAAERVSRTAPELDQIVSLIREINSMPIEKLKKMGEALKQANRLVTHAPDLEKVVTLVNLIADTPTDKLEKLEKVLKQANKLVAHAPNELLEFLFSLKEE